ncbi:MAG TPA: hypothetical protein IGS17_04695 [Oscillatoriales cyanobacterium M59_W2019_021]|nr:hypothetical protein [Oscillatoriales cyanobacterium M4454_W2019_049]HIK50216.1 hypothetical protein [Oscillatoriales cyanobacterium M59_W2019_021]
MKIQWKQLVIRSAIWLATEVLLTVAGLDDLADYSEFVFEKHASIAIVRIATIV